MRHPRTFRNMWLLVLTASLFSSPPLRANDELIPLGAGGLILTKPSQIALESEKVQISVHEITVKYVFRNIGDDDVDATVEFPLPKLDGAMVENLPLQFPSDDPVDFLSFKVWVDGKRVFPMTQIRAFSYGRDITDRLRALGLPISVLDPSMEDAINRLPNAQREQLEREHVIVSEEISQQLEQHRWPEWEMRVRYYWTQHFPSNTNIEVLHTYRPIVGRTDIDSEDKEQSVVGRFCGGLAAAKQIKDWKTQLGATGPESDTALYGRSVRYAPTDGRSWGGPIRNFALVVESDSTDDMVLTCMPGIKKSGPKRYEVELQNFRPDGELDVLILQAQQ